MKLCPICEKEIKKGDWIIEGRQFGWFKAERMIRINCLGKPINNPCIVKTYKKRKVINVCSSEPGSGLFIEV